MTTTSTTATEAYAALKSAQYDMTMIIHSRQRDRLIAAGYADYAGDGPKGRLLRYWLSAPRTSEGYIPMSATIYSKIVKWDYRAIRNHHLRMRSEIYALRADGIIARMSHFTPGTNNTNGIATQITSLQFPSSIDAIIYDRDPIYCKREGWVDIATGKLLSYQDLRRLEQTARHHANEYNTKAEIDEHRDWYDYLNNTLTSYNFRLPESRTAATLKLYDKYFARYTRLRNTMGDNCDDGQALREAAQELRTAMNMLHGFYHVSLFPQPVYVRSRRSPRFYATGQSLLTMPTEVRQALYPNVIECDLASAQAAIYATIIGVPSLTRLLTDHLLGGPSLWEYLFSILDVTDTKKKDLLKPILKRFVYSLCFGMDGKRLLKPKYLTRIDEYGQKLSYSTDNAQVQRALAYLKSLDGRKKIMSDPLIMEWLDARDAVLTQIETNGSMTDAYVRWINIGMADDPGDPFDAKSVLAYVIQSWEVKLLEPVRQLAIEAAKKTSHTWRILLWQHDGFSITCETRDADHIVDSLQHAVHAFASELDIPTKLEVKYDGIRKGETASL